MNLTDKKLKKILRSVGLHIGTDILHYSDYAFTRYTSKEYLNSERHETDQVYRMSEGNLLHKTSGLRIMYTSTEDYYGEHVEYKVIDMFIITKENRHLTVLDVDFERQVFETSQGLVPFSATEGRIE